MFICPKCKKANAVKCGLRKNKSGFVQKYQCKDCGYLFVNRKGFERMRTNPEIIVTALDLRASGMSFGKICEHILKRYNKKISRKTILDWQKKFGEMINNFTKQFSLISSENTHVDEVYLRKKGHKKEEFIYYWDAIDFDTKFLIADHISNEKNEDEGKAFMRRIKSALRKYPIRIHTDNSYDYPNAIKWIFGRRSVIHVHFPAWKCKFKNNAIERYHNTLKENYKVMRKFGSTRTAYEYLTFFRNYYNFLRPHTTLCGLTPAEAAGFGRWNWWSLIRAIIIVRLFLADN